MTAGARATVWATWGSATISLGEYRQAIDLYTQALAIAREIGYRQGEGAALGNLGVCHQHLGEYRQAIDLLTQALAIVREIGYRQGEGDRAGLPGALPSAAWASTGRLSTCSPRHWPSPATSATAMARRNARVSGPGPAGDR